LLVAVKSQAADVNLAEPLPALRQGLVVQGVLRQLRLLSGWRWHGGVVLGQGFLLWGVFLLPLHLLNGLHWGLAVTAVAVRVVHTLILTTFTVFTRFTSLGDS
jgi:hypothetical protein